MKKEIAIGVDVGGSHVSCAAYNLKEKRIIPNTLSESDLDNHGTADEIFAIWGGVVKQTMDLVGAENVAGIGFAMPGPFDYPNGISRLSGESGKYENTYGMDVPAELRKFLGLSNDFKIRFINDTTAFAIAEDQLGMAKDFSRSLSVALGTGFGSAFIKDGLPVVDGDEVPKHGCVWHLPFLDGIADDYFSTRGFIKRYKDGTGKEVSGVREIAELAEKDSFALGLFTSYGENMGKFLKPWIQKFNMEAFVIGGKVAKAYPLFGPSLTGYLEKENIHLQVFISELMETAAFIGSATLIDDDFYEHVKPLLGKM
ncbi:ROK family protein [Bacteroidota bacterium]